MVFLIFVSLTSLIFVAIYQNTVCGVFSYSPHTVFMGTKYTTGYILDYTAGARPPQERNLMYHSMAHILTIKFSRSSVRHFFVCVIFSGLCFLIIGCRMVSFVLLLVYTFITFSNHGIGYTFCKGSESFKEYLPVLKQVRIRLYSVKCCNKLPKWRGLRLKTIRWILYNHFFAQKASLESFKTIWEFFNMYF